MQTAAELTALKAKHAAAEEKERIAGKKRHQFSGGDPNGLRQWVTQLATESEKYDVEITLR